MYGCCLLGVWKICQGVGKVSGRCLSGVCEVSRRVLGGSRTIRVRTCQVWTGQVRSGQEINKHLRMEFDSGVGPTCFDIF